MLSMRIDAYNQVTQLYTVYKRFKRHRRSAECSRSRSRPDVIIRSQKVQYPEASDIREDKGKPAQIND